MPHPEAFTIVCGTSRKREGPDEPSAGTSNDRQRRKLAPSEPAAPVNTTERPLCGNRPIVKMVVHWNTKQTTIHALLNTGCSTSLISKSFVDKMGIPCLPHQTDIVIRNFTGDIVPGAGYEYTKPILLQHRKYYTREVFEVSPLEPEVDVFLPFWWIAKHPPQGAWDSPELRFSSPACLDLCTKTAVREFSLSLDDSILSHPEARFIGYVSAVDLTANDSLEQVPEEFRQFLGIMGKDAADALPEHCSYDHAIDLRVGESAPWGPIYPLSEHELETLRKWLKEMLRTGKIQRSTSSAGSPILFVP